MTMYHIYLAGPITGLTFDDSQNWRDDFTLRLPNSRVMCLTPMRGKEYLRAGGVIDSKQLETYGHTLSSESSIMTRDFFDCSRADVVVADLRKRPGKVSIGTVMECAWSYANHTPLVAILDEDPENDFNTQPMIQRAIGFRTYSVQEAADITAVILNIHV